MYSIFAKMIVTRSEYQEVSKNDELCMSSKQDIDSYSSCRFGRDLDFPVQI